MGNNILGRNCLRAEKLCFQVRKDTFGHVCKLFRRKDLVSKLLGFLLPAYYFRDFEVNHLGNLGNYNLDFKGIDDGTHLVIIVRCGFLGFIDTSPEFTNLDLIICLGLLAGLCDIVFLLDVGHVLIQAVHLGYIVFFLLLQITLTLAEVVVLFNLLLHFETASGPFLLKLFSDSLQLDILIETHHVLDVLTDSLSEDVFFQKVAGLHGVEKEVLA